MHKIVGAVVQAVLGVKPHITWSGLHAPTFARFRAAYGLITMPGGAPIGTLRAFDDSQGGVIVELRIRTPEGVRMYWFETGGAFPTWAGRRPLLAMEETARLLREPEEAMA